MKRKVGIKPISTPTPSAAFRERWIKGPLSVLVAEDAGDTPSEVESVGGVLCVKKVGIALAPVWTASATAGAADGVNKGKSAACHATEIGCA